MRNTTEGAAAAATDRATHITLLVDESGSMADRRSIIIEGFNGFIAAQREILCDRCSVSTYFFSDASRAIYEDLPLEDVPLLGLEDYIPRGPTALRDALGDVLRNIQHREHAAGTAYLVAVLTDGMENSSTRTTQQQLDALIEDTKGRVQITYVGSNQDAAREGAAVGASHGSSLDYDDNALDAAIGAMSQAIGRVRTGDTQELAYTPCEREASSGRMTVVLSV